MYINVREAIMQDDHYPGLLKPQDQVGRQVVDRPVITPQDREQTQHRSLIVLFDSLRQRIHYLLHPNQRGAKYTLLLPDGHLLILCCATLSQLVCDCVSVEQNKEVGCTL